MHAPLLSSADTQCIPPDLTGCLLAQGIARTWEDAVHGPFGAQRHLHGAWRALHDDPHALTADPHITPPGRSPSRFGVPTRYLPPWRIALWRCRP